ncbi:MAG: hypothetical protein ACOY2B_13600 [Pseudomonadota bacterium]
MAVTSFNIDEKMANTLDKLKVHLSASSKAEVLRKAVALLTIAVESEAEDGSITIRKDNVDQKIIIK